MQAALSKDLKSILAMPLTAVQAALAQALLSHTLTDVDRDTHIQAIRQSLSPAEHSRFDQDNAAVAAAVAAGQATTMPTFATPELRLLWAAHLTHFVAQGGVPLERTGLWRQLIQSDDAKNEKMRHAFFIARDQFNPSTSIAWGTPGSMFYFSGGENRINIDFLMSMIVGFEDTRSVIYHEIAHSKLMRGFTKKLAETRKEIEELQEKGKTKGITGPEYARLAGLSMTWKILFMVFDEAENSPANRYGINASQKLGQDMGLSLNIAETVIVRPHENQMPQKADPETLFRNLKLAMRMSLYKNNGLIDDTANGWKSIGVRTDWITARSKVTGQPDLVGQAAFDELMDLCGGPKGLEHLQPTNIDRMSGAMWLDKVTNEYAEKRNEIIDDIWDRYVQPIVQPLIDATAQNAQQNVQKAQQQAQQNAQQQGQQQGQSQSGQQSSGSGGGEQGEGASSPSDGTASSDGKKQELGENMVDVEKAGPMPVDDVPPETPQEAKDKAQKGSGQSQDVDGQDGADGQGEGQDGNGQDGEGSDQGESIEALLKEKDNQDRGDHQLSQAEKAAQAAAALVNGKQQKGAASPKGGVSKASGSSRPEIGNWGDFQAAVAQYQPEIRQARKIFVQIQNKQTQKRSKPSSARELIPDDGDMDRFDHSIHEVLVQKIAKGDTVVERDVKRFSVDHQYEVPGAIDVILLPDGSGSMFMTPGNSKYSVFQGAIQSACVLSVGAQKPRDRSTKRGEGDINVWTVIWGNDPPECITQPGDDPQKTGKAIASMMGQKGSSWGTSLAPAVVYTAKMLSEYRAGGNYPTGHVHYIVISDGDISDDDESVKAIDTLLTNCPRTTFDVLVVTGGSRWETMMERTMKALQDKHGDARLKTVRCDAPEQAHVAILALLRERMLATTHIEAESSLKRRKTFRKAYQALKAYKL